MLYLAGDTGMRPGEYLALPRFNLSSAEVKVDRAVERNGDKISVTKTPAGWRWIDLSPETADMVMHYADHLPRQTDTTWCFRHQAVTGNLSATGGNSVLAQYATRLG